MHPADIARRSSGIPVSGGVPIRIEAHGGDSTWAEYVITRQTSLLSGLFIPLMAPVGSNLTVVILRGGDDGLILGPRLQWEQPTKAAKGKEERPGGYLQGKHWSEC